jgi:DNA invertase Pin-like site-specific DNA recombinase
LNCSNAHGVSFVSVTQQFNTTTSMGRLTLNVHELVRDLRERNIQTKTKQLATGATRGGIPFGRGALYYLLGNHFYIGEVKYKNEILPGEQPSIMDRAETGWWGL